EHGATAMLLCPYLCALVLLRKVNKAEIAVLIAAFALFMMKDPATVIARRYLRWRRPHDDVPTASIWLSAEFVLMAFATVVLTTSGKLTPLLPAGEAGAGFLVLAVLMGVYNKQRWVVFQVISAAALTSTCIAAILVARGDVPAWGWQLWELCAAQAAAGILAV